MRQISLILIELLVFKEVVRQFDEGHRDEMNRTTKYKVSVVWELPNFFKGKIFSMSFIKICELPL